MSTFPSTSTGVAFASVPTFRVAFEAAPTKLPRIASGFAWLHPTAIGSSWTRLDLWSRQTFWSSPGLKTKVAPGLGLFWFGVLPICWWRKFAVSYWSVGKLPSSKNWCRFASLSLWRWNKNRVKGTDPLLLRTFMYQYHAYMLHLVNLYVAYCGIFLPVNPTPDIYTSQM